MEGGECEVWSLQERKATIFMETNLYDNFKIDYRYKNNFLRYRVPILVITRKAAFWVSVADPNDSDLDPQHCF